MTKIKCIAAAALLHLILGGCGPLIVFGTGAAAGVGGYRYYQGSSITVYDAPFERTWEAGLKAVQVLGSTVKDARHDLTSGTVSAEQADGTPVTLKTKYVSAEQTEVAIRVGFWGDEEGGAVIARRIRETLEGQV